jgi:glycosyltransferase involved in cell wall biosynthesis
MTRSVLVLDTYYIDALRELRADKKFPAQATYAAELSRVTDYGFGTGGAYVRALLAHHWDASIIVPNSLGLQDLWAGENNHARPLGLGWKYVQVLARPPIARDFLRWVPHAHKILLQQVKNIRPDVLLVQDLNALPPSLVRHLKKYAGVVIGEIASPLPPDAFVKSYDRIISALPSIVEKAQSLGVPATFVPLGFDARWATVRESQLREIDVVFVGSFSRLQPNTAPLLRAIAEAVPGFRVYGTAKAEVLKEAGLTKNYHGPVWGKEMFSVLGNSKIVVNRHGTVAGRYAVNMRMYETTGAGAALITEQKSNLQDLFDIGTEVKAYNDIDEAVAMTISLLKNPSTLSALAHAGQQRTLRDHTYDRRAESLIEIFEKDLKEKQRI